MAPAPASDVKVGSTSPEYLVADTYSLTDAQLAESMEFIEEIGKIVVASSRWEMRMRRLLMSPVRFWELGFSVELPFATGFIAQENCGQARPSHKRAHDSRSRSFDVSSWRYDDMGDLHFLTTLPLQLSSVLKLRLYAASSHNVQMERNENRSYIKR
jgi:hypothetical protein